MDTVYPSENSNYWNWRHFGRQVNILTKANLKSRYRKTVGGFLWVVINPLVMFGVQSQIFHSFLKINIPQYYLFLASGLLPWIFIVQSLEMGVPIFQYSSELLKSYPTNPLVYLTAQILDNFFNFVCAFLIVLIIVSIKEPGSLRGFVFLPLPLLLIITGVVGIVWFLATLQIFLRDTKFVMSFSLNVAYFLTPIFYPTEMVPDSMKWITKVNPIYILIRPFRICIYSFDYQQFWGALLQSAIVAIGALGIAALFWKRKKNEIYFNL